MTETLIKNDLTMFSCYYYLILFDLNDGSEDHSRPPSPPRTVDQTVAALGEVVDQVQDVVHEVALGGDLEVRDGSVVNDKATFLSVEVQQTVHARVLLKLVGLGQDKHHPQLVLLALLDEVIPLPEVLHDVSRHPSREQSTRHQLLQARNMLQELGKLFLSPFYSDLEEHKTNQVAEESGVGQIDLIPVIRVQSGSLVLRDLILQLDLVDSLASCLEDVEMSQTSK